jgi:NTE family protein
MLFRPKIGLVLGGGGARGGAHVGVLRVLAEMGCKPDIVVGASFGGLVTVACGLGWTPEQMEALLRDEDFSALLKLDRSGAGLIGTARMEARMREVFGDGDLRDLSPRTAVVAADIRRNERVLIDRGPIVQALRATMAVPGLFPPVWWGERLLVDGGIISNVPTQAAYQLGAERVIAVDLGDDLDLGLTLSDVGSFSKNLQRALYWLLNLSHRQAVFDTAIRSMMLSFRTLSQYEMALYPPDVLLRPDIPHVGLLALERATDTMAAGEQAARSAAEEIRAMMRRGYRRQRRGPGRLPPLAVAEGEGVH